ncbi:hypothetical protein D9M71_206970 [compost metagenome]
MGQQMVDLRHQWFQFHRHLIIELRTLALLKLRNLLAGLLQRTQGPAHGNPLQQQNQQQRRQTETKPELLHAPEAFANWRVVLGDADGDRQPRTSIVRTQHQ